MRKLAEGEMTLDHESQSLSKMIRSNASPEKRQELEKQLKGVLQTQFAVRQQRRSLELRRLEDQVHVLRQQLEKREQNKSAIIDRRFSELTGVIGWDF